jgi:FkbM family methyltransferase
MLDALKRASRRSLPAGLHRRLAALYRHLARLDPRRLRRLAAFHRANRTEPESRIVLRSWLALEIDPRSREAFAWYAYGNLEAAAELDAFTAEAASRFCLLDVGASHGVFSLAFTHGRPGATALAIEPSPIAFEILAENLRRNHRETIVALPVAVGDRAGELAVRQAWHHLEAVAEGEPASLSVRVERLDALCAARGFRPDLVKVDVEGFELAVLSGARRLLAEAKPPLFLEVHPRRLGELGVSTADLLELLAGLGYRFRSLAGRALSRPALTVRESVFHLICRVGEGR